MGLISSSPKDKENEGGDGRWGGQLWEVARGITVNKGFVMLI